VEFVDRLAYRLERVVDPLLAVVEVGACLRLEAFKLCAGKIEELLVVAAQGLGGDGLEDVGELLACSIEQRDFLA
ncbi:MAG: hypothetical protein ACK559_41670, partial [bacterium]